jgi:hypothetical protein
MSLKMFRILGTGKLRQNICVNLGVTALITPLILRTPLTFLWTSKVASFQVLTAVSMKMTVFWDAAPCSLVEIDRRFRGTYCLHHRGDNRADRHLRNRLW